MENISDRRDGHICQLNIYFFVDHEMKKYNQKRLKQLISTYILWWIEENITKLFETISWLLISWCCTQTPSFTKSSSKKLLIISLISIDYHMSWTEKLYVVMSCKNFFRQKLNVILTLCYHSYTELIPTKL
jgi:hypothetical protein